jgi:hypothetical protein
MRTELKEIYLSPRVEATQVELEQGIAGGSASASPNDSRTLDW